MKGRDVSLWFAVETKVRERKSKRVLQQFRLNVEAASRTAAISRAHDWADKDEHAEKYGDHTFDWERGRVFQMPEGWLPSKSKAGDDERLGCVAVTLAADPNDPPF
ncbi:hypothetical protein V4D07_26310 [Paenibacillus taichungensis]